ncbi:MAG: UvrD-helicase domain-containing protein [Pyrinomonadaceae bacterium]
MEFTEQQRQIIEYGGNAVIIAMPGSGKTAVVSEKVRQYVCQMKAYEGVVAISYTNKASRELRDRCTRNGLDTKNSFFGTIDTFAIAEIVVPFARDLLGAASVEVTVRKAFSLEEEMKGAFNWVNRSLEVKDINDERLGQLKALFTNDGILLLETVGILANMVFDASVACRNYLKARYKYIFIDEYQDAGEAQHQMFLNIVELGIVGFAVGDVNQSIYAFSGKSSKYLSELLNAEAFHGFPLTINHRCHPSIINYSNRFLDPNAPLLPTDKIHVFYKNVPGDENEVAAWIEKCVPRIVEVFTPDSLSSIAVLTRSNITAELINQYLNISRKLSVSTNLDESFHVWSQIFSKLLFYTFSRNQQLIDVVNEFTSFDSLRYRERKTLRELQSKIRSSFVDQIDVQAVIDSFVTIAVTVAPNSESVESVDLLRETLENSLLTHSYKPATPDEVNILTIHKSKGLEFDVVFHLDLHEWILPAERIESGKRFYPDWEQDLNTHYVGLTRAKTACILVTSTFRTNSYRQRKTGSDSEFLNRPELRELRVSK